MQICRKRLQALKILRDPLWQFIGVIVSVIAVLIPLIAFANPVFVINGTVVACIVLVLYFSNLRPNKTIFFRVISDAVVLSIKEEDVKAEVQILYKGEEVKDDIHMVILRLWNASYDPILPEEYKGTSIKLNFGKAAKVLSAQVTEAKPSTIKEEIDNNKLIQLDAGFLILNPMWLNSDNSISLKVLVTKFDGVVTTDESRIIVGGFVSDWNKSRYNKGKKIIDWLISPFSLFISLLVSFDIIFIAEEISIFYYKFDFLAVALKNQIVSLTEIVSFFVIAFLIYVVVKKYSLKWVYKTFD